MLIVLKFGGTSVADAVCIGRAAARLASEAQRGHQVVAVVSAQGDTTDAILHRALELSAAPPPRELDTCLSVGEQLSAGLMAMAITELGRDACSLTGIQAGIMTDGVHGNARILGLRNDRIREELNQGRVVVVAGFQGANGFGDITTLGRGGSDTTAVALAAYLKADECRIYTDVDGIYDQDPRAFPDAVRLETVDYDRMLSMARSGAQVLHDRCVELAMIYRVPIRVLSSFRPGAGTLVTDRLQ